MEKMGKKEDTSIPIYDPLNVQSIADTPFAHKFVKFAQMWMKWYCLVLLTVQNALLSILMRVSRTQRALFITSTAVLTTEAAKLAISLLAIFFLDERASVRRFLAILDKCILKQPLDTLKVSIPSLIYFVQNNLLYIGATHLDAATCQVTYQLKILTTALFSVFLLRRRLFGHQWVALVVLFAGVALVQVAQAGTSTPGHHAQRPLVGLAAVVAACCLSGFAGVYFEMILKGSAEVTVWMRNVQLCVTSVPFGLLSVFVYDGQEVAEKGFFYGYTEVVWWTIVLQALGGLIVALVVAYADNILKGFATSLAILLSCAFQVAFFDFQISLAFAAGAALVIASTFLYSKKPPTDK